MKTTTRYGLRPTLLAVILLLGISTQAQVDVGCIRINSPADGDSIYSNENNIGVEYVRKNFGAPLPANHDTLHMDFIVDGNWVGNVIRSNTNSFLTGAEESRTATLNQAALNLTPGWHSFCVATRIANDTNQSNDSSCISLYFSGTGYPYDLSLGQFRITNPQLTDGQTIKVGTPLTAISGQITNNSSKDIAPGFALQLSITVNGVSQNVNLTANGGLNSGATANFNLDGSQNLNLPSIPNSPGPVDICAELVDPDDPNLQNNEECLQVTAEEEQQQTTGLAEQQEATVTFLVQQNHLEVQLDRPLRKEQILRVIAISGRTVLSHSIYAGSESTKIDLSALPSGVYIVELNQKRYKFHH